MTGGKVFTGVKRFEGAIFAKWYGWAQRGVAYEEGPLRWLKLRARLDARRLVKRFP